MDKKITNICFDEFIQNDDKVKPYTVVKPSRTNYSEFTFKKTKPLEYVGIKDNAIQEAMDKAVKQYEEWYVKRKDESIIDTIMLIKSGFFPTYKFYKEWYMQQEECVHNVKMFENNVVMQDNWTFRGKPIISLLDEHIYDYIVKNYGGR